MLSCPYMLMIGGNSRHAGKTSLACSVIRRLSVKHSIIGLKITTVKPGRNEFHGNHSGEPDDDYTILEETDFSGEKDTSQMLRAGAGKVFYIRAGEDFFEEAITRFLSEIGQNHPIVCESRSLRNYLKPGIFCLMMRTPEPEKEKDMRFYESLVDEICFSAYDPAVIAKLADRIIFTNTGWALLPSTEK